MRWNRIWAGQQAYLRQELDILINKEVTDTGTLELVLDKAFCIVQAPLD